MITWYDFLPRPLPQQKVRFIPCLNLIHKKFSQYLPMFLNQIILYFKLLFTFEYGSIHQIFNLLNSRYFELVLEKVNSCECVDVCGTVKDREEDYWEYAVNEEDVNKNLGDHAPVLPSSFFFSPIFELFLFLLFYRFSNFLLFFVVDGPSFIFCTVSRSYW